MKTWEYAIGVIARRIDLPRFNLTVLIEDPWNNTSRGPAEKWLQACKKFFRPLTRQKKKKKRKEKRPNLFIHLSWPYGSEKQYVSMLEKSVFGEHYDAINHGKYCVKPPFWHDYWSQGGPVLQASCLKIWPPDYWNAIDPGSHPDSKNCNRVGVKHRDIWNRVWGPEESIIWLHEA